MVNLDSCFNRYELHVGHPNVLSHFSPLNYCLELLPMTSYFSDIVKDLKDRTEIATKTLMENEETAEVSLDSTLAIIFKRICISTDLVDCVAKHLTLSLERVLSFVMG